MSKDLTGILKEKLAKYSIRQTEIAGIIERSPGHIGDILHGRKSPTLTTFLKILDAIEVLRPGFCYEYWQTVAESDSPSLQAMVDALDSQQLGLLLSLVGQRIAAKAKPAQSKQERISDSLPQDHPIAV